MGFSFFFLSSFLEVHCDERGFVFQARLFFPLRVRDTKRAAQNWRMHAIGEAPLGEQRRDVPPMHTANQPSRDSMNVIAPRQYGETILHLLHTDPALFCCHTVQS